MRVSTMRKADRWLGVPACALLTRMRRAGSWLRSAPSTDPRRIAFVKLAEQGSTVLACSAIRRAIDLVGREHVFFVVFEENRFILDVLDLIDPENVLTIRTGSLGQTIRGALGVIRRMRALRIDTTIDLEFFARSTAALCYLAGAGRRVGFHAFGDGGPYRGDLMTHRVIFNPHRHTTETFRMLVEAVPRTPRELPVLDLAATVDERPPPPFRPDAAEVAQAHELLKRAAGADRFQPLILLNANAGDLLPLRRWPRQRYVELARRLLDRYPRARVAMTGAPDESPAVERLVEQVDSARCFSLAGRTTLRQLLVVYGLAQVLVTNDSGPAHFASLTTIDVVTLFGPETPELFAARGPRNHVLWENIACSPCVSALNHRHSPCRDNVCMQRIDVDRVFDVVCGIYEDRAGSNPVASEIRS